MSIRLLLLILFLHSATALSAPLVVTSIPPLQEVAGAVMAGVGEAQAIIGDGDSAHHFALRPSHMRLLREADLVIWIDNQFEAGFARLSQTLPHSAARLVLLPALELDGEESHDDAGHGATDRNHAGHGKDGHIWYSSRLLRQVVTLVTGQLSGIDPQNAAQYRLNAERLANDIERWRAATLLQLQARPPRYIVDHQFTGHFDADLGYGPIASIHDQHDNHGSLGELAEIEALLRATPARCLLTLEPRPAPLALELARKFKLEIISLASGDDAGSAEPAIIRRLQRLSAALARCGA